MQRACARITCPRSFMKRNGEAGSLAENARNGELGIVAVNDPAGYRQAEPGSFGIDEAGLIVAVEPLENGIDLIVGYADARVLDAFIGRAEPCGFAVAKTMGAKTSVEVCLASGRYGSFAGCFGKRWAQKCRFLRIMLRSASCFGPFAALSVACGKTRGRTEVIARF